MPVGTLDFLATFGGIYKLRARTRPHRLLALAGLFPTHRRQTAANWNEKSRAPPTPHHKESVRVRLSGLRTQAARLNKGNAA